MNIYLDNAATTKLSEKAFDEMKKAFFDMYGNPSSRHFKGVDAEKLVNEARKTIASELKCEEKEIVFTSGGTESNNMALIGTALANRRRGKHIITTNFEHASVYNPLLFLEKEGYEITFAKADSMGRVDPSYLASLVRDDTILVSTMMVNNEVGSVLDIAALTKAVKAKNPNTLYHVDAIQGFPKYKILPKKLGVDLMSVSSHKFNGPKGCGFIFIKDKTKISPIIFGGGQQKDMRSGTENVPGIVGMTAAISEYCKKREENCEKMYALKERLVKGLLALNGTGNIDGIRINALFEENDDPKSVDVETLKTRIRATAPHIVSVGFPKAKSEVFLHVLEMKGICVSSGSACSSNHPAISGSLKAIGVPNEYLDTTLRFSLSPDNTGDEIDYVIKTIKEELPTYMQFFRK